jgi:hypothetical protein
MPQCFDRTSELEQLSLFHIVVLENIIQDLQDVAATQFGE